MDRILVDLRHAYYSLKNRLWSSVGTVLILSIGVGLTATIFAIADPYLLRPLPYRDPEQLIILLVGRSPDDLDFTGSTEADVPAFAEWRARTDLFSDIAAYGEFERIRVTTASNAVRAITVRTVSPNFLHVLGVGSDAGLAGRPPAAGRRLLWLGAPRDGVRSESDHPVAGSLQRGEDGALFEIGSGLPTGFLFPYTASTWRPDALSPHDFGAVAWRRPQSLGRSYLTAVGRLQPGVTAQAVETALNARASRAGLRVRAEPLRAYMTDGLRPLALGALAAGLMIVLVCTSNVMSLTIARGLFRQRDYATRQALGASRLDLARLIVFELLAIAGAAVVISLFVARLMLIAIAEVIPDRYAGLGDPAVTMRVALFTIALGLVIVAVCALPAWLGAVSASTAAISRSQGGEPRALRWLRFLLGAAQTAVAMILLVAAGLLARSYANLWLQDTGYSADAKLVSVSYPPSRSSSRMLATVADTIVALRRVPGVTDAAAGATVGFLLDGYSAGGGRRLQIGDRNTMLVPSQVTAGYFDVAGTRLLAGRPIEAHDKGWSAIVVNEAFAQKFWPHLQPQRVVGESVVANGAPGVVVGVVQNTHDHALDTKPAVRIFIPLEVQAGLPRRISYPIRVNGSVAAETIRQAVISPDSDAIVESIGSIHARLAETVRDRSFATLILGIFAAAGIGVTATGILAVVAFVAARRTREIAIRVALGADAAHIRWLVVKGAAMAALCGGLGGLVLGRLFAKALESQLYGVHTGDLTTPALAAAGMTIITGLAAWWPTRRALRLDPAKALRIE